MIANDFQIQILINILPIIIINTLIAIIVFLVSSFLMLSVQNHYINAKNMSEYKKKLYYLILGIIPVVFMFTIQTVFDSLLKTPQLNNANNLNDAQIILIRDTFFWFFIFLTQLFFIIVCSLKTSFFASLLPLVFLVPIQYIIPVVSNEINSEAINIVKLFIFGTGGILFLLITRAFLKKKILWTSLLALFTSLVLLAVDALINFAFSVNNDCFVDALFIHGFALIYFFVCYAIVDNIFTRITKANTLKRNILFDQFHFVRNSYAEAYFMNWLVNNKRDIGYMFKMQLSNENFVSKTLGTKISQNIMKLAILKIVSQFHRKFLFVRGRKGEFYFFAKSSNWKSVLNDMEQIQKILPNKFTFKKYPIHIKFNFYGARYGLDANHFEGLVDCLDNASQDKGFNTSNFLIMYQDKNHFDELQFQKDFENLKEEIKINNIKVKISSSDFIWDVKLVINNNEVSNLKEFFNKIEDREIKKLLMRHIAYKALKAFSYETGIINLPYMTEIIEDKNFDLKAFLNVINKIGIRYNSIHLKFIDNQLDNTNLIYQRIQKIGIQLN